MSAGESRLALRSDAAWVDAGDRVLVLALGAPDARPVALEDTAAEVWRAVVAASALPDHPTATFDAVVTALAEGYATAPEAIRADVEAFLHDLAGRGLLVFETHVTAPR